jgi:hypothetical protein
MIGEDGGDRHGEDGRQRKASALATARIANGAEGLEEGGGGEREVDAGSWRQVDGIGRLHEALLVMMVEVALLIITKGRRCVSFPAPENAIALSIRGFT